MPHGCPYQLQHPPQSSFPSHNPSTPVPSYSTSRYNLTSPPTTITVSRVFTPASRRRPQMFQLSAPRNAPLSPLRGRPAILAIITPFTSSARALFQPVAPQSLVEAMPALDMCLHVLVWCHSDAKLWRAESLQPIGCTGSARHPGPGPSPCNPDPGTTESYLPKPLPPNRKTRRLLRVVQQTLPF